MSFVTDKQKKVSDLSCYYRHLFPFPLIHRWLNYGNGPLYFRRREFSYAFLNGTVVRFRSFTSCRKFFDSIVKVVPARIDIGAVYTMSMEEKRHPKFAPCEKELVFDIDISDYDDVRFCCKGVKLCEKCWKFMVVACKILDVALREDFGFQHLLWVFSGRRGIHCWVCDTSVRRLTPDARAAIGGYLQVVEGGSYMPKKVTIEDKIHPSISRALDIIKEYFPAVSLEDQDILGTPRRFKLFFKALGNDVEFVERVEERIFEVRSSKDRWAAFVNYVAELKNTGCLKEEHKFIVEEMMLQYLYPRLDMAVTSGIKHLLKCPFSIHPENGNISVPFSFKDVEHFNPETVPTIKLVINEVLAEKMKPISRPSSSSGPSKYVITDPSKYVITSLHDYYVIFHEFVVALEESRINEVKTNLPLEPLKLNW